MNPASFLDTGQVARVMRNAIQRGQTNRRNVPADPDWALPPARLHPHSFCEKNPLGGHVRVAGHAGRDECQLCRMPIA